jgi:hypothetical protein
MSQISPAIGEEAPVEGVTSGGGAYAQAIEEAFGDDLEAWGTS